MKTKWYVLGPCVLMLFAGMGWAQGTVFSVGASYWRAALDYEAEGLEGIKIDPGNLIGPYANLRMGKLILGGSYFTGSFKIDMGDLLGGPLADVEVDAKIKRNDLNLSAGYSLNRYLTLFGAYKRETLSLEGSITYTDPWTGQEVTEDLADESEAVKESFYGGGLSVVFPFSGSPLFAFGSAAYLAASGDEMDDITTVTLGLGLSTSSNLTFLVGYRVDAMGKETENQEKIKGVTATLAYTFR